MLHQLKLSPDILRPLQEVVLCQVSCLFCALWATNPTAAEPTIDETDFAGFVDVFLAEAERGHRLLTWLRTAPKCHNYVKNFACVFTAQDQQGRQREWETKEAWLARIHQEIQDLLDQDTPTLVVGNFFFDNDQPKRQNKDALPWKRAAGDFFLSFYKNYLSSLGKDPFPKSFLPNGIPAFDRKQFLASFVDANKHQEICAVCDQTRYYAYRGGQVQAIVDHYLPNADYPHFSCHPYNLVPCCYTCNSSTKGTSDPFLDQQNQRHPLQKTSLPYHEDLNLRAAFYLKVDLHTPNPATKQASLGIDDLVFTLGPLLPRDDYLQLAALSKDIIEEAAEVLSTLYDIPKRWNDPGQSNRIRSTLFRRMRQFLGEGTRTPQGTDSQAHMHSVLKLLLYYLDQEDQQRDPFAFAMTWMLVALLNEYVQPLTKPTANKTIPNKAIIEEILSWYGLSLEKNIGREEIADKLCAVPRKSSQP